MDVHPAPDPNVKSHFGTQIQCAKLRQIARPNARLWSVSFPEQRVQIKWPRHHRQVTLSRPWPLLEWKVPVKLNSVIVRIAQVERVADSVIGRALKRNPRLNQSVQGIRQFRPGGIENRKMVESRRPPCRRLPPRLSQVFRPM